MDGSDDDIRFVVSHPRFRGVSPARGRPGEYLLRVADDDGKDVRFVGPLSDVFKNACDYLRRVP